MNKLQLQSFSHREQYFKVTMMLYFCRTHRYCQAVILQHAKWHITYTARRIQYRQIQNFRPRAEHPHQHPCYPVLSLSACCTSRSVISSTDTWNTNALNSSMIPSPQEATTYLWPAEGDSQQQCTSIKALKMSKGQ